VASKVLTETVHVKKGETVTVEAWNNGLGFARHVLAEARAMGCTAILLLEDEKAYVEGVRRAPKDTLGTMGRHELGLLSATDAYIFVPGAPLWAFSKTLNPQELADSTRYNSSWYEAAAKAKLRGARMTFGYAGPDMARMVGKSVDKIVSAQLKAALVDFGDVSAAAARLVPSLGDGAHANLETHGTRLGFELKGELGVEDGVVDADDVASGNNVAYVPPGIVSKDVEPTSASGKVKISASLTRFGLVDGATLTFSGGVLTSWDGKGKDKLDALLKPLPQEKRRLTTMNVGLNPAMKYGFGRDIFVKGAISVGGFGFTAAIRRGSLASDGKALITEGNLD
jgi:leucyl aminopeptidase (aminopeptidase T)